MKRLRIPVLVLVVLLLAVSAVQANALQEIQQRGRVRILINTGVPPFSFLDENGNPTGFCIELGRLVAEIRGGDGEFVDVDWAGLIPSLMAGRADMIGERMSATLQRAMNISFADPYLLTGTIAYTTNRTDFTHISEIDQPGVRVGVILGTIGEALAREKLKHAEVIPYDSTADTTQALLAGRCDVVLEDDIVAYNEIKKDPSMRTLEGYLYVDTYAFAVRQGEQDLLNWLNLFFETIKRSGEFGELYEKWLEFEWQPTVQKQL